jgi:hypothetical protein
MKTKRPRKILTTILWKYNKTTGFWVYQRDCDIMLADQWLSIFQGDEPDEHFQLRMFKPTRRPQTETAYAD